MGDTPYSRRFNARLLLLEWAFAAVLAGIITFTSYLESVVRQGPWGMLLFFALAMSLPMLPVFYCRRVNRLHLRELERSGWRLCTHCTQDLTGLGTTGICPECGQRFDVVRDAAAWKVDLRIEQRAIEPYVEAYFHAGRAVRQLWRKLTMRSDNKK